MVLCDPCAGEGHAIERMAIRLGVPQERIVAAELEVGRSEALMRRLPRAHVTGSVDFLSATYGSGGASVLYLNPPYDSELGYSERLESTFLSRATNILVAQGILIYVVPRSRVRGGGLRKMVHNLYADVESFDFPEELRDYDECVVIATKRRRPINDEFTHMGFLRSTSELSVRDARAGVMFAFRKQQYTDQELLKLMRTDRAIESMTGNHRESRQLRPPLELGDGHKALLLAAGYLNGRVAKPGRPPHVVRGTSRKVERVKETTKAGGYVTQVIEERIQLLIRKVDASGVIDDIVDGSGGEVSEVECER